MSSRISAASTSASSVCECCYRALRKQRLRRNNSLWRVHGHRHGRSRPRRPYTHALEGSATRRMHARSRYHAGGLGNFPFFTAAFHNRRKRAVTIFLANFFYFSSLLLSSFPLQVLRKARVSVARFFHHVRHCAVE